MKKGSKIPSDMDKVDSQGHYMNARSYIESIFVMMLSQARFNLKDDFPLSITTMFLGGFAIELYLKAYLRNKKINAGDIKTHDLERLFSLCRKNGFKSEDDSKIKTLIGLFSETHKKGQFRYFDIGKDNYRICSLPFFFDWFTILDDAVSETLDTIERRPGIYWGWRYPIDKLPDWRFRDSE